MSSNMNGMVIYVSRNRDMLLAIKLVEHLDLRMQRPLAVKANKDGDYTLVVYQKNHGLNLADLQRVRLTSSTYGKMELHDCNEDCPFFAKLLLDSVGEGEPTTLKELDLNKNTIQRLTSNGIKNVAELLATRKSLLKKLPNIGKITLEEIELALSKHRLKLNPFN